MTDCTKLSDRMIEVAHGKSVWSADEAAHLTACRECDAEWRLVGGAMHVGASATTALQPSVLATRVLADLRQRRARRSGVRVWFRLAPVALAAGLVLAVVHRGGLDGATGRATVAAGDILPEFQDLTEAQLETLLEVVPRTDGSVEIRGFNDLSDDDVTSLLSNLEG